MFKGLGMAMAVLDAMSSGRRSFKPKTAYRMPSQSVASKELHLDRAVVAELAAMEADEARIVGDADRITIADRYFREAQQMLTAARVKLRQLETVDA